MQVLQCNKVLFGGYMNQYLIVSFQAVVLFPIVVAVFTLPKLVLTSTNKGPYAA